MLVYVWPANRIARISQGSQVLALVVQVLRELDAAMDSRDVDRLEEAIKKGDAFAKRAPINHFMAQVSTASTACRSQIFVYEEAHLPADTYLCFPADAL